MNIKIPIIITNVPCAVDRCENTRDEYHTSVSISMFKEILQGIVDPAEIIGGEMVHCDWCQEDQENCQ